jgi:hypothetical protein
MPSEIDGVVMLTAGEVQELRLLRIQAKERAAAAAKAKEEEEVDFFSINKHFLIKFLYF